MIRDFVGLVYFKQILFLILKNIDNKILKSATILFFVIRDFVGLVYFKQILFLILKNIDNKILKSATIFSYRK